MGFNVRKSTTIAGVRVTASKSGLSYSVGGHGVRVTKTARGRVRSTVGIPGTGVSYSKTLGTASLTPSARHAATPGSARPATPAKPLSPRKQRKATRSGFINVMKRVHPEVLPKLSRKAMAARAEKCTDTLKAGASAFTMIGLELQTGDYTSIVEACVFLKRATMAYAPELMASVQAACDEALRTETELLPAFRSKSGTTS